MPPARPLIAAALATCLLSTSALAAGPMALSAAQEKAMGIVLATAKPASGAPLAALPGAITPPLNDRRVVAAPFAGTVTRIHVLEGQSVRAGAPLVTLFSREALTVSSELVQSQAELRVAEAAARRLQQLANEGVIAGARAEEAQARLAQARAMVNERRRLLSGAGGTSGEYVLRAPIAGRVAAVTAQPGGGLEAMAPAVTLDRADRLWVEARVSPEIARKLKVGYRVQVGDIAGRIVALGASIDPKTRSLPLRAELDTAVGIAPGQTVTVTVLSPAPTGAQAIPRSALAQDSAGARVFVKTAAGYEARSVTVVGAAGAEAVVTGLFPGARVAASGAAQLKSALGH
ncbi:cobalt-zinc-cadmium efflux system membrane fusion protein [Caulobacter sp. BE264]|uniref:efflux RND transporter periplasmic adaptor subunit n=1 Tax=Caulobacter sp. BE264 TaxID=2817724 RepID=UPI00285FD154|nr:efflux RND transporter periplasmic adaptor subunit [Caulobacter sp. BE264]MDR7232752.1 cobalt-zinc-cadmium efflux system membrane fusion protein [Caulobacter sp. BE264]